MIIAGVDESGRGPLAGPVIAAAVILNPKRVIRGLADSKCLSEKKREILYKKITEKALDYAVGQASVEEIDTINILQASLLAMRRAVSQLSKKPAYVLVDGNQDPKLPYQTTLIVRGDETEAAISAASIIAKVTRDRLMYHLNQEYPGYGLAQHKGYATKQHLKALMSLGASLCHRRSFRPVLECVWIT